MHANRYRYLIFLLPVIIVVLLDTALYFIVAKDSSYTDRLKVKPDTNKIYAMGNSMFQTGIDFNLLNKILPEKEHADFEYHNGYYTSLWYLIVKKAIVPAGRHPRLLIWGFRPTYAITPAFRQGKIGDIEKFNDGTDILFQSKTSGQKLSWKDRFKIWLGNHSFLYGKRGRIQEGVSKVINRLSISFVKSFTMKDSLTEIEDAFISKNMSVLDLVVKQQTKGRFVMIEETVADGVEIIVTGEKIFIKGEKVSFKESFVPDIASSVSMAGIPQLILIYRPAADTIDAETRKFADEAENYFKENDINYINFMKDDRLIRELYAKGDHYNEKGRELITRTVAEKVVSMLEEINGGKRVNGE